MGRTLPIWNKYLKNAQFKNGEPWLLHFFDQVRFYEVTEEELEAQRDAFREGRAQVRIEETEFDFAQYTQFLADNAEDIADFRSRQSAAFTAEVAHWAAQESAAVEAAANAVQVVEYQSEQDGHLVSADLNGNVWKILVEPGQQVEEVRR
ncbi:Allophanate hydrolase subunit 2 [Ewingella americana]|uniref:Allophanate hydrolase subunit 2 n=1 Tax=Ewingella americana TaxID=41202 RepID=A0A377N8Z8_9GAMM|nr:Allophanate hydrolase subunit 2 [Ewingella americana]